MRGSRFPRASVGHAAATRGRTEEAAPRNDDPASWTNDAARRGSAPRGASLRRMRRRIRIPPFAAFASLLAVAAPLAAQDLALMRLAAKCDSQIAWITDGYSSPDLGRPEMLPKVGPDRGALLDQALKRAADEKKLVFWYVQRI